MTTTYVEHVQNLRKGSATSPVPGRKARRKFDPAGRHTNRTAAKRAAIREHS